MHVTAHELQTPEHETAVLLRPSATTSEANAAARFERAAQTQVGVLCRLARAVVEAERVEQIFEAALAGVEAALGADRAAIATFDAGGKLTFKRWRNLAAEYRTAVEGDSPWRVDAGTPEPLLVPDVERDPAMASYLPTLRREGISALACIPLVSGGQVLGKLTIYHERSRSFGSHEVETARAIADQLASGIARFALVAKLEETVHHNELFLRALAHGLRNSLATIITGTQLVLMCHSGDRANLGRAAKPLSTILTSGRRMMQMIDQLLDFTRTRARGIEVRLGETNLAELCAQVLQRVQIAHADRKVSCELLGDPIGSWDTCRLLQVITILVENAEQHGSADAAIVVKVDGTHRDDVTLEVHNQGTVPESLLPSLFDPFRSSCHRRAHSRGLGLDLYMVREVVRAHGGQVDVTSTEASGTTFTVQLPRHSVACNPGPGRNARA